MGRDYKTSFGTYNKAFTVQKSIFDDILLDFDVVMERPYNGIFDYKQHYILLWVQELYKLLYVTTK